MAPQNKRSAAKAPVVAKKAKVEKVEVKPEDPFIAQLAPVFATLAASKLPSSCCELLQAALPHCVGGSPQQRHPYQAQMLELAFSAIKDDEATKRANLNEAQQKIGQLQAELVASKADSEAAAALASSKKEESEKKSEEVALALAEVEASKLAMEFEIKNKEEFSEKKTAIIAEELAFKTVLAEQWDPLRASSFLGGQYRKRDKAITDLLEKIRPLDLEDCLLDALVASLKLKQDRRSEFAEKAIKFVENALARYQSTLTERVEATSPQEQEHEKAVTDSESKLSEMREKHSEREKEHVQLENAWADLETNANQAKEMVYENNSSLKAAETDAENKQNDLNAVLAVFDVFSKIKEPEKTKIVETHEQAAVVVDLEEPDANMEDGVPAVSAQVELSLEEMEVAAVAVAA